MLFASPPTHLHPSFSRALEVAPDSSVLLTNRAMARLRINDMRGALRDSCTAVALDPQSHKALHKRSEAKRRLGLLQVVGEGCDEGLPCIEQHSSVSRASHGLHNPSLLFFSCVS